MIPLPISDREIWSRTLSFVLLGFLCYALPWPTQASESQTLLRIQGSNTIGAQLAPALVTGLLEQQGYQAIRVLPSASENEQQVLAYSPAGQSVRVLIAAHGSGTGFSALANSSADLAASSRPIKDSEIEQLAPIGDFKSPRAEQTIALDGLAVIVHPNNPVQALSSEQLAAVFSGNISNWAELGGEQQPIRVYARDAQSGTFDTFSELVLKPFAKELSPTAQRFESSAALSDSVSIDPGGIGFIGLPYIRQTRALNIANGESQAMPASKHLITTEDYPLARRLYFYHVPQPSNAWVTALVNFAHSDKGQQIVEDSGFIAQNIQAMQVPSDPRMPASYQALSTTGKRLTLNFRFQEGSATLDSKALRDLDRLSAYLSRHKAKNNVVLVGFGDAKNDPARAELLSRLRAMAVRRELFKRQIIPKQILGMGEQLPVATNADDSGRIRNRRVEVWLQ